MGSPNVEGTPRKFYYFTQISLRFVAIGVTLAAAWLMMSNNETAVVFGIQVDARYTYAPAFKFLAIANLVALAFSLLSVIVTFVVRKRALKPAHFYIFFIHDLKGKLEKYCHLNLMGKKR
ncbi:CASP-like protein 1F1 [Striga hermonthica]|uniref:CASP-like protein n=1 Tax=Striga hermonthica TaxID=68872 RepID=A0A9N7R260_STRHE|nr:CASP-like protein 1F1 [Striga hermonthica]